VRHEGPFEFVRDGKPEQIIGLRTRVMSDRLFSPLSCVESLLPRRRSLGICRITKMPQDGVTPCQPIRNESVGRFRKNAREIIL
jgi:hypothetical protein